MDRRKQIRSDLIRTLVRMGYPEDFGNAIADEMLAIMEDRER